jgi:hypothetical protein
MGNIVAGIDRPLVDVSGVDAGVEASVVEW